MHFPVIDRSGSAFVRPVFQASHPVRPPPCPFPGAQSQPEDDGDPEEDDLEEEGSAAAGSAPAEGPTSKLYGDWQTGPWHRPVAMDGIVPKNEFGNVECPPLLPELPVGTVHLEEYPGIWVDCK